MSAAEGLFTFSNYYHDHMVLQKSSTGTTIWGHSSKVGDVVHIKMNNNEVFQAVVQNNQIWEAKFTSPSDHGPYVISAVSSLGTIQISDVLFGDVWICSGQSNMEFNTDKVEQFLFNVKIIYIYIYKASMYVLVFCSCLIPQKNIPTLQATKASGSFISTGNFQQHL